MIAPETTPSRTWLSLLILAGCAFLLLVRLGHYPLWDDEACTAILARGVWLSGDSLAVQGDNVMAFGHGAMLFGDYDRVHPPLQQYLMAPFVGLMGSTALAARLPFALTGLVAIALLLWWYTRAGASGRTWLIVAVLLLTNVALFLFLRQGRYYALAVLFSLLSAYLYVHLPPRPSVGRMLGLGASLGAFPLITAQGFACLAPVFLVDYLLFGRRRVRWGLAGWAALLGPSLASCLLILAVWNPLVIAGGPWNAEWWHRPLMIWWAFRDLNHAHLGVGALLLAAPLLAYLTKNQLLLRGCLAVAVFCIMEALVNPQTPAIVEYAEVRHLTPVILACLAIAACVIDAIWRWRRWAGVVVLLLAGFTNVLHWGALQGGIRLRSVQYLWARELLHPPATSYQQAIAWLDAHVPPGATVGVEPDWMRYPLMFHRPRFIYTWQIRPEHRERLAHLDPRQFRGVEPPEWFVCFGLWDDGQFFAADALAQDGGRRYQRVAQSDLYWRDMFRPEINMREFTAEAIAARMINPHRAGIYLYRLTDP